MCVHVQLLFVCVQDFKEQVIHHTATMTLLTFSWISNYIRVGTLVMAVHDCSDIVLEVSTISTSLHVQSSLSDIYGCSVGQCNIEKTTVNLNCPSSAVTLM